MLYLSLAFAVAANYAVCGGYVGWPRLDTCQKWVFSLKCPTSRSHPSTCTRTWLSQARASKTEEAHTLFTEPLGG